MLILSFLWLYFYVVLISAHPIFRSMENDKVHSKIDTLYNSQNRGLYKRGFSREFNNRSTMFMNNKIKYNHLKRKLTSTPIQLVDFEMFQPSSKDRNFPVSKSKIYRPTSLDNNLSYKDDILSTAINQLKDLNEYNYELENLDLQAADTNRNSDLAGTAEVEAILDKIKEREIEIIGEQTPFVTELISNCVTEISNKPNILKSTTIYGHSDLNTKFSINTTNIRQKRFTTKSTTSLKYKMFQQSLQNEAQEIENKLQDELKKVYRKMKTKFSKEFSKEMKVTKSTIKSHLNKLKNKLSGSCEVTKAKTIIKNHLNITTPITTMATNLTIQSHRSSKKHSKKYRDSEIPLTTSMEALTTIGDDYTLLSLYEQMLSKDNVISISTQNAPIHGHVDNGRISKRNSLRFLNINLIGKNNPVHLGGSKTPDAMDSLIANKSPSTTSNNITIANEIYAKPIYAEQVPSFEALRNQVSYKNYVNGYKYYLNFQKEQGNQNYSNLVRYQAHRHHDVDDIGKFILSKIPPIASTRFRRDFVESETLEDQDISTKSEDSWFKKRFFVFLDTSPPKKFHSTQMVNMKFCSTEQHFNNKSWKTVLSDVNYNKERKIRSAYSTAKYKIVTENSANSGYYNYFV